MAMPAGGMISHRIMLMIMIMMVIVRRVIMTAVLRMALMMMVMVMVMVMTTGHNRLTRTVAPAAPQQQQTNPGNGGGTDRLHQGFRLTRSPARPVLQQQKRPADQHHG